LNESGCRSLSFTREFVTDIRKELDGFELAMLEASTQMVGYAEKDELWKGARAAGRRLADLNATRSNMVAPIPKGLEEVSRLDVEFFLDVHPSA